MSEYEVKRKRDKGTREGVRVVEERAQFLNKNTQKVESVLLPDILWKLFSLLPHITFSEISNSHSCVLLESIWRMFGGHSNILGWHKKRSGYGYLLYRMRNVGGRHS